MINEFTRRIDTCLTKHQNKIYEMIFLHLALAASHFRSRSQDLLHNIPVGFSHLCKSRLQLVDQSSNPGYGLNRENVFTFFQLCM